MNYSAAHYRDLANYDTLVLPLQASIAPLIGNGLERWYINQVIRRTYLAVTGVGFMCRTSTSAGGVMLQVLPPRPVSPVGRPARPTLDEFGYPLAPPPRRLSKLNILRRVRLVLLAVRAARATYLATALVQYEQTLHRAADPFAAQAARLKQCAEHLLSLKSPLSIITTGQTPDQAGQRSELPSGQRYYFPMGWPVGEIAKLLAEIQLFDKLHREFEANILAQPIEIHATPATTAPPQPNSPILDTPAPTVADLCRLPFTPALIVIKSQAQVLSETITQITTDAEARANTKGLTLGKKSGNPVPPAPPQPLDTPAAFWKALRRMPMEVEWVNDSPRYTVPVHLLGSEDFNEDLRPLREAFEAALPKLKTKHLRLLHHDLSELLSIDRQRFRRQEVLYNEKKYALQFLPDDYSILRFEVAKPGRGLAKPWQWVNPSIWTGFVVLMKHKQEVARAIYDKISAALDKPPYSFSATTPQPNSPILDTPAPTVADLCRLPFTPADLNELLVRLKVISSAGTCLTNDLKGKAQGPRAAFAAAYRVLHRAGLLNPVVADKIWATAFLQAYGAKLGKGAISHKLTVHGTAFKPAPLPFTEAVNTTREWVNEWQNRL